MSDEWLASLHQPGYRWEDALPGATQEQIRDLERFCGRPLPPEYVDLVTVTNGAVVGFDDLWLIHLWSVQDIPSWSEAYGFGPDTTPGMLPLGDNEGSEALVFDIRPAQPDGHYPVLAINLIGLEWREALHVSDRKGL
jgi:hypothetical protein